MLRGTIAVKRLLVSGEKNPNNHMIPNGLETAIDKYIKGETPSMYLLKHMEDILPQFIEKNTGRMKVDPNKAIGIVTGFDDNYVYFKPKNRNVKHLFNDKNRALFVYNANTDSKKNIFDVSDVQLIYIQEEIPGELEKIMRPKELTVKQALNNYNINKRAEAIKKEEVKIEPSQKLVETSEPPKEIKPHKRQNQKEDKSDKDSQSKRTTKSTFIVTD